MTTETKIRTLKELVQEAEQLKKGDPVPISVDEANKLLRNGATTTGRPVEEKEGTILTIIWALRYEDNGQEFFYQVKTDGILQLGYDGFHCIPRDSPTKAH
ncbi:hypothetical protein HYX03_02250 [Candidatus Woesearchaeota archaeon]|nr:hypothetical protein [Candidatus Woesearchaeota archaeon]